MQMRGLFLRNCELSYANYLIVRTSSFFESNKKNVNLADAPRGVSSNTRRLC
jgi:hypothetical protein